MADLTMHLRSSTSRQLKQAAGLLPLQMHMWLRRGTPNTQSMTSSGSSGEPQPGDSSASTVHTS